MADRYVYHAGSNTSPYDTWAKAATTLGTAITGSAAGDRFLIAADHAETLGASTTYTFPGTRASPNYFISLQRSNSSYLKATAAQITATGTTYDIIFGGSFIAWGLFITAGDDFSFGAGGELHEIRDSNLGLSGSASSLLFTTSGNGVHRFDSVTFNFSHATRGSAELFACSNNTAGILLFHNCVVQYASATQPDAIFSSSTADFAIIHAVNCDFSPITTGVLTCLTITTVYVYLLNCKVGAGIVLITAASVNDKESFVKMVGCDNATDNDIERFAYQDNYGTVNDDTAIYRTAGASDGTVNLSMKMVSTANAVDFYRPLVFEKIVNWNETTGSKTFTVHGIWDSATNIQNDEIWMELYYLGTAADTRGLMSNDGKANPIVAAADQSASTEAWTGTGGFTNANKFKLDVTVTINRKGCWGVKVFLAKPSTTVYICPKVEIA